MPNKAITNAKRNRAGALGQSSRFYNIFGQKVASSANVLLERALVVQKYTQMGPENIVSQRIF